MMVVMTSCAPVVAFSRPGIAPQSAPPSRPASTGRHQVDDRGQIEREPDVGREDRRDRDLALGADVEQAGPERDRHGQAGRDERGGEEQGAGQGPEDLRHAAAAEVDDRAPEQRPVRLHHAGDDRGQHVARAREEVRRGRADVVVADRDEDGPRPPSP
jgi:hypothetical protein